MNAALQKVQLFRRRKNPPQHPLQILSTTPFSEMKFRPLKVFAVLFWLLEVYFFEATNLI